MQLGRIVLGGQFTRLARLRCAADVGFRVVRPGNHVLEDVVSAFATLAALIASTLAGCFALLRLAIAALALALPLAATGIGTLATDIFDTLTCRLALTLAATVLAETATRATSLAAVGSTFCGRTFDGRSSFHYHCCVAGRGFLRLAGARSATLARLGRLAGIGSHLACRRIALWAAVLLLAARRHQVAQAPAQPFAARRGRLSAIACALLTGCRSVGISRHTCIHGIWQGAHNVFQFKWFRPCAAWNTDSAVGMALRVLIRGSR
ncbi:hypothetical protein SAMD00023378_4289 [Ralstonia sp. NT80]|nr:hypothetical protein SAMD00023378_4289 [Ralstonia sp. NT80]